MSYPLSILLQALANMVKAVRRFSGGIFLKRMSVKKQLVATGSV